MLSVQFKSVVFVLWLSGFPRINISLHILDRHQHSTLQRHGGFHLAAVRPAAELPTQHLQPQLPQDHVPVLRHPGALQGTASCGSINRIYVRDTPFQTPLSLFAGQPKGEKPQQLCGVSQRDQRQRANQRPQWIHQSQAAPSNPHHGTVNYHSGR